jgi:hypothetical protein
MTPSSLFRRNLLPLLVLAAFAAGGVARAAEPFPNRIDPSVLESAQKGPNAAVYFNREIPVLFRSDVPVDILNLSSATASVLMLGKYHSPRGTVDLEMHGRLQNGALEMDFPLSRLDAAMYEWEDVGAQPKGLKGLDANLRTLTFRDDAGFRGVYLVRKSIEYQLTVDVPYNSEKKTLMPPQPPYDRSAEFIRWLEKDVRSRAILENNTSGLPIFVSVAESTDTLAAGFLSDTIRWNMRTGRREFAYSESLNHLQRLPEIKRLLKDPQVKAFVEGTEPVAVKAIGSDDAGFSFSLSKEGGRHLEATLVNKRVSVKP